MPEPKPSIYTTDELLQQLKNRQGGLSQDMYAREIGISRQLLSDIYRSYREVGNEQVLKFLAPTGYYFQKRDSFILTPGPKPGLKK
jgi:Helix-turn-helix